MTEKVRDCATVLKQCQGHWGIFKQQTTNWLRELGAQGCATELQHLEVPISIHIEVSRRLVK